MKIRYLAAAAVVVLLGACATVPPARDDRKVAELIDRVNAGPVDWALEQSHVPFFFDAELLVRSADVELMWQGLRESSLIVQPEGFSLEPARSGDYARIAETFDMQTFFSPEGSFPEEATWLLADSNLGQLLILLGDRSARLPVIYGIARVER